jgi:hypothetical protein
MFLRRCGISVDGYEIGWQSNEWHYARVSAVHKQLAWYSRTTWMLFGSFHGVDIGAEWALEISHRIMVRLRRLPP